MTPPLIDLYRDDLDSISNTHDRQAARREWLRAVIETFHERALTATPVPGRRRQAPGALVLVEVRIHGVLVRVEYPDTAPVMERVKVFWNRVSDDDLHDLLEVLRPYFRRPENRGQPL